MTDRTSHRGGVVLWVLCLACALAWAQVSPAVEGILAGVPDPRAAHSSTPSTATRDLSEAPLKPLLFAPETRWEEDAPAPTHFQHRHVQGKKPNNARLFELVNALLPQVEANLPTPRDR